MILDLHGAPCRVHGGGGGASNQYYFVNLKLMFGHFLPEGLKKGYNHAF